MTIATLISVLAAGAALLLALTVARVQTSKRLDKDLVAAIKLNNMASDELTATLRKVDSILTVGVGKLTYSPAKHSLWPRTQADIALWTALAEARPTRARDEIAIWRAAANPRTAAEVRRLLEAQATLLSEHWGVHRTRVEQNAWAAVQAEAVRYPLSWPAREDTHADELETRQTSDAARAELS